MIQKILNTSDDWSGLVLRLTLGIILFPHGAQKMLGWYSGYGFDGTMTFFTQTLGLPVLVSFTVIFIEFAGSLLLISGLLTRINALMVIGLFTGIILFAGHLEYGFFMNWFGSQKGEGYEYHLLIIGIALSLLFTGGGKLSVDKKILEGIQNRADKKV